MRIQLGSDVNMITIFWLLAASASAISSGASVDTQCDEYPRYTPGSISKLILYDDASYNDDLTFVPTLKYSVTTVYSDVNHSLVSAMDTGSTGLCISASKLGLKGTDFETINPSGYEYLSSSGRLWEGYWVQANVSFPDTGIISSVPILAVTNSSRCTSQHFSNGHCADEHKENFQHWPPDIKYMGVGFGRWSFEQPQALPDKVPFTNIVSIDGRPPTNIHPGYIITSLGVHLGLTTDNTQSFEKTKLQLRPGSNLDADWQMVKMAITVNDLPWSIGSALFDTGINQSYITLDKAVQVQLPTQQYTNSRTNKSMKVIVPGNKIKLLVGDDPLDHPMAYYNVIANDTSNPMDPDEGEFIPVVGHGHGPYINTGRFFYRCFDLMYDAKCGWFGLRWKGDPNDPNGGTYVPHGKLKGQKSALVTQSAQDVMLD